MQIAQLTLRCVQLFFTIIVTALIGNVIQTAYSGNPSSVNFAMFVAVLCWISVLVGFAAGFMDSIPKLVELALDGIAVLFTFIVAVVLAAKLGVHSCGNAAYLVSNNLTNGSGNKGSRCHELQAATAFFWFLFALFIATLGMAVMSSRGSGLGGIRKGGPSMSQV